MKYKVIIIFFNVFMLLLFLTLFFLPITVLGWGYISKFWIDNWFLPIIFFAIILIINLFFVFNWSIIKYTERGNWDGIINIVEKRIYEKNMITYPNVRLLAHSYFLLGKEIKIKKLENYVKSKKKSIYNKAFLMFCCAHLISDSNDSLKIYFEEAINNKALKGMNWILICYAFVLISGKEFDKVLLILDKIGKVKNNPVLELTKLYFMFIASKHEDHENIIRQKEGFVKKVSALKFAKHFEIEKGEIHILFLSKIISHAKEWAYKSQSA